MPGYEVGAFEAVVWLIDGFSGTVWGSKTFSYRYREGVGGPTLLAKSVSTGQRAQKGFNYGFGNA